MEGINGQNCYRSFNGVNNLKKLKLYDCKFSGTNNELLGYSKIEEIDGQDSLLAFTGNMFVANSYIKKINCPIDMSAGTGMFLHNCTQLEPCFIHYNNPSGKSFKVYGDSTHFMSGVKGVTVSNQAPFDNATSPQLDVSYTGLDRAALVNLFKSMPYNVGYTVVGSPTITDGVVSGFSADDYLELSNSFSNQQPFEIILKLKFSSSPATQYILSGNGFYVYLSDTRKISCQAQVSGGWIYAGTNDALSYDTDYWVKFVYDGTGLSCSYSTDGVSYTEGLSAQSQLTSHNLSFKVGSRSSYQSFGGSLDLNATSIKVNGVPFFTGTAAMTKTCSVVGCTGTADLTADDKAIATDKGWSLTVA